MSSRRDIEARLGLYDEVAGILRAMRSFALTELRAVIRRREAQQQVVATLRLALQDLASALPPSNPVTTDVWVLLGSARGFCGSLNEDVVRHWRDRGGNGCPTVVIGERLVRLVPETPMVFPVSGVVGALDAPEAIDRILVGLTKARHHAGQESGLMVCLHGDDAVRAERLLPLQVPPGITDPRTPLTYEPAAVVATGVAEHLLFHTLLDLLLEAVKVENHRRLLQMEHALRHLERGTEDLQRQRSRLRQEEIIEEIELLVQKRSRGDGPAGFRP